MVCLTVIGDGRGGIGGGYEAGECIISGISKVSGLEDGGGVRGGAGFGTEVGRFLVITVGGGGRELIDTGGSRGLGGRA